MTLSGDITIGEQTRHFDKEFLSPKHPRPLAFHIVIADEQYSVQSAVSARFMHAHMISNEPIPRELQGELWCGTWERDARWHVEFTAR
jgi:hypothetical protein